MNLAFAFPAAVSLLGLASLNDKQARPTVELAVFHAEYVAGFADSRLTGELQVTDYGWRPLRVRRFFPLSGCGLAAADGFIVGAEPGLEGFVGQRAVFYQDMEHLSSDSLLIVYPEAVIELPEPDLEDIQRVLRGLHKAFC